MSRRSREPLPFPLLVEWVEIPCTGCGYDLSGLGGVVSVCPECGLAIGPERVLCCAGVPRSVETRVWRRVAWGFIFISGFLFLQLWGLMIMFLGGLFTLAAFTLVLVATVAMFATGRRKSRTTERLVFSWGGIGRSSWGVRDAESEIMEWPASVSVRVTPVGMVWQKLRIDEIDGGRRKSRFFECGFRCERERGPWVEATIRALSRGEAVPPEEPVGGVPEIPQSIVDGEAEELGSGA